ncbi:DNA-directed DNA polymerase alpha subunit pol12, partial [Rhizopus stolonifer]
MSTETQIQRVFELGDNDKTIASELTSLCNLYSLTPDHLKFKWEAFALNTGCSIKPTLPYIKHLKNALQRELDRGRKTRKTIKGKVVTKRSQAMDLSEYGISQPYSEDSVESFMSTMMHSTTKPHKVVPLSSSNLTDTHISPMSSQFMTRKTSHLIESQHNPHLPLIDKPEQPSAIQFSHLEPPIQEYRYMFEKIKERADMLDERIEYISSLIIQAHQIELSNPTRPHQEPIYTCGRICSDSEDKLNETSVLLQTSKDLGMGRRVKLDLAGLEQYSLFPGQIVGLYGRNTNGEVFSVERILLPPLPEPCAPMQADNRPLEMITAAGPFTLNDDLSFQPLEDLLQMCATQKPDVILLMGPFVSSQHPRIFSGKIETLPEQIFADQIYKRLEQVLDILVHTHVLM